MGKIHIFAILSFKWFDSRTEEKPNRRLSKWLPAPHSVPLLFWRHNSSGRGSSWGSVSVDFVVFLPLTLQENVTANNNKNNEAKCYSYGCDLTSLFLNTQERNCFYIEFHKPRKYCFMNLFSRNNWVWYVYN